MKSEFPQNASDRPETERERAGRRALRARRRAATQHDQQAATDLLTGASLRGPGIVALQREMERAVRTNSHLLVAFVDVDALQTVNESHGREAGDRLLVAVAQTLAERLRPYDRIVRYGGDEFVCVLRDISEADAARRFAEVNACLSWEPDSGSISCGVTVMVAGDSAASLVERAQAERYRKPTR